MDGFFATVDCKFRRAPYSGSPHRPSLLHVFHEWTSDERRHAAIVASPDGRLLTGRRPLREFAPSAAFSGSVNDLRPLPEQPRKTWRNGGWALLPVAVSPTGKSARPTVSWRLPFLRDALSRSVPSRVSRTHCHSHCLFPPFVFGVHAKPPTMAAHEKLDLHPLSSFGTLIVADCRLVSFDLRCHRANSEWVFVGVMKKNYRIISMFLDNSTDSCLSRLRVASSMGSINSPVRSFSMSMRTVNV